MTVFVHMGPAKTGSTALQRFAHQNRGFFAERGLVYPETVAGPSPPHNHGNAFRWLADEAANDDATAAFWQACRRHVEAGSDLLLSYEQLYANFLIWSDSSWMPELALGHGAYGDASHAAFWHEDSELLARYRDRLARVRAAFGDATVVAVLVLRPQALWGESHLRQQITSGYMSAPTVQAGFERLVHYLDVARHVQEIGQYFDAVLPIPYPGGRPEFAYRFFAALGYDASDAPESPKHVNRTEVAWFTEIKRQVDQDLAPEDRMGKNARLHAAVRTTMPGGEVFTSRGGVRETFWPSRAEAAAFQARFGDGNRWLAERYGVAPPALDDLSALDGQTPFAGLTDAAWRRYVAAAASLIQVK